MTPQISTVNTSSPVDRIHTAKKKRTQRGEDAHQELVDGSVWLLGTSGIGGHTWYNDGLKRMVNTKKGWLLINSKMTVPLGKDKKMRRMKRIVLGTPQGLFKDIYSILGFRTMQ